MDTLLIVEIIKLRNKSPLNEEMQFFNKTSKNMFHFTSRKVQNYNGALFFVRLAKRKVVESPD